MMLFAALRPSLIAAADRRESMLKQLLGILPLQEHRRGDGIAVLPPRAADLVSIEQRSALGLQTTIRYKLPGCPIQLVEEQRLTLRGWEFSFTIEGLAADKAGDFPEIIPEDPHLWI